MFTAAALLEWTAEDESKARTSTSLRFDTSFVLGIGRTIDDDRVSSLDRSEHRNIRCLLGPINVSLKRDRIYNEQARIYRVPSFVRSASLQTLMEDTRGSW